LEYFQIEVSSPKFGCPKPLLRPSRVCPSPSPLVFFPPHKKLSFLQKSAHALAFDLDPFFLEFRTVFFYVRRSIPSTPTRVNSLFPPVQADAFILYLPSAAKISSFSASVLPSDELVSLFSCVGCPQFSYGIFNPRLIYACPVSPNLGDAKCVIRHTVRST